VIYFVLIFGIYLANLALWLKNRLTLDELGTGYSFVISSILANRLLIAVRVNYYTKDEERDPPHSSIYFADLDIYNTMRTKTQQDMTIHRTTQGRSLDESGEIELDTFDDRRGF